MKTAWIVLLLVAAAPRIAGADIDDPTYTCHAIDPATKIRVTFKPDVPLKDLVAWALGFTCKNFVFAADVAKHAIKVNVIAPREMTPKQAMELFVDAVEATGLVVVQKPDTIIIKRGPSMPPSCPDLTDAPAIAPTAPIATAPPDPELTDAELSAGIHTTDATHRVVSAALVAKILANPMAVANGARVVPWVKNGAAAGFKLYAIRPSSVFARLGLDNGDAIVAVNGFALDTADHALEIYAKLRDAKSLSVTIERRGAPLTLVWTIQ